MIQAYDSVGFASVSCRTCVAVAALIFQVRMLLCREVEEDFGMPSPDAALQGLGDYQDTRPTSHPRHMPPAVPCQAQTPCSTDAIFATGCLLRGAVEGARPQAPALLEWSARCHFRPEGGMNLLRYLVDGKPQRSELSACQPEDLVCLAIRRNGCW